MALLFYLVVTLVSVSVLAGLYPALALSKAQPINALKGAMSKGKSNMFFRRFLVFMQFLLCQILIFGTIVTTRQMNYFMSVDMGYDQEWILNVNLRDYSEGAQNLWASRLESVSGVEDFTFSYKPPFSGSVSSTNGYYYTSDTARIELSTHVKMADHNYAKTYGLDMVAGKWLSKSDTTNKYVVNEEFLSKAGIEDPSEAIGKIVNVWGVRAPIVGVVKNYHVTRLDEKIEPVAMFNAKQDYRTLGLRVVSSKADDVIASLEEIWFEVSEEYEFSYSFLDEEVAMYYDGERKMSQLLTVFAGIAIFIGCLGLYGLVAFIANQKAKEIGIRKVLGASVANLMRRFSTEFLVLVLIAFPFASVFGYLLMSGWLQQYEYRIEIGPLIFLVSVGASIIIAMATTGYRSLRAATANPVNSLRDQ